MSGAKKKPIPIPLAVRWQSFRTVVIPPLFFVGLCLTIAWLWQDHVHPVAMTGEVEAIEGLVTSPIDGLISQVHVKPQEQVVAGQLIATLVPRDARLAEARLAVVRSEIELIAVGMDPIMSRRRVEYDEQQLAVEAMKQRVEIATARINLVNAEAMYERAQRLQSEGAGSVAELEQAEALRDSLLADIAGREELVADLEQGLERLRLAPRDQQGREQAENDISQARIDDDPILTAINLQREKLKLIEAELAPLEVLAPIDGTVGSTLRLIGENLQAGESIVAIQANETQRIIAYMQPPVAFEPEVGMRIEVMKRDFSRLTGEAEVIGVNRHFETLPVSMTGNTMAYAKGLPVFVSLPPGLALRPGELVDLRLIPSD